MIYGNIDGVRNTVLDSLEKIYFIKSQKYELCNREIIDIIVEATRRIDREISVCIDKRGKVEEVTIGDSTSVSLPIIDPTEKKLSGKKIVHTHPSGVSRLSALDISALLKLKLDVIAAVSVAEEPKVTLGFITVRDNLLYPESTKEMSINEALAFDVLDVISHNENLLKSSDYEEVIEETAILVGIESIELLDELEELSEAAGIRVSQKVMQKREKADNTFYIGSGKVEELASIAQLTKSNVIICDDELSGIQIKNMEDLVGIKVIDRTTLILEIFSRRAKTKEARLQIELAQLRYRMNRLLGMGLVMSRTGGGIGTRGPGETKLETDRRKIRERFYDLSNELKDITRIRQTQRENRRRQDLPQVAIVGYTNAGKSTLRNALANMAGRENIKKEDVFEADMLFATLDTTTRAIELQDKRTITLTDTVGFIRKLPHDLVEAFKSTLEEVIYADILIHVVDGSSSNCLEEVNAVESVLNSLGAVNKPTVIALNKCDKGEDEKAKIVEEIYSSKFKVIRISAKKNINLDLVLKEIENLLPDDYKEHEFLIPYDEGKLLNLLHSEGNVLKEDYKEEGTLLKAQIKDSLLGKFQGFILREVKDE